MGMGRRGLFASVNIICQYAPLIDADGRSFVVVGPKSLYRDPELGGNPWRYYFKPVFPGVKLPKDPVAVQDIYQEAIAQFEQPLTPRLKWGMRPGMCLPHDRHKAGALLDKYIRLNTTAQAFVDDFAETFLQGPVIGLHIRGPGGTHGGAAELRALLDPHAPVPFQHYFAAVDTALETYPDATLFTCSDSAGVLTQVRARYGDRVLVYPASRSDYGEMHEPTAPETSRTFSPYKLGLDIVVEAHLLARCTHFVHGLSNVGNYVLSRAPDMPHSYVYAEVEPILHARLRQEMAAQDPTTRGM